MTTLRGGAASWLAVAGLLTALPAVAGPLLITPTTVEFAPGRRGAVIEVTNQGEATADLQFRAFDWSQGADGDRLSPTTALAISPPIATVPPHGKQTFRVLALDETPVTSERSYRLKLNELPRPTDGAVAVNVEFSLPVFMTPPGAVPNVGASVIGDGTAIDIANTGARRLRITALTITDGAGHATVLPLRRITYLLAGSTQRLALPPGVHAAPGGRLTGTADTGSIDVPLATVPAR